MSLAPEYTPSERWSASLLGHDTSVDGEDSDGASGRGARILTINVAVFAWRELASAGLRF